MRFWKEGLIVVLLSSLCSCQKKYFFTQSFSKDVVEALKSHHAADVLRTLPQRRVMESIMVCTKKGEENLTTAIKKAESLLQEKQRHFQATFPHVQILSSKISKVQNVQRGQSQGDCIVSRDFDLVHINVLIQYSSHPVRKQYLQMDTLYIDSRYYLLDIHNHDG